MRSYRRVLALVTVTADGEAVARRAVQLARFHRATLALAAVVDYTPGLECDHAPFMTPEQMRHTIVRDVRGKLDRLASNIEHDGGCEIIVACSRERDLVGQLIRSWRPDIVLVGSRAPHGIDKNVGKTPFDVLIVQNGRQSFTGRLINALAASL
jgi:hypothetical protein